MGGSTSFSGGEVSRTGVVRVFFRFRTSGKGQVICPCRCQDRMALCSCMTNKEGESDTGMAIGASSPRQVVNNGAIFILSRTVVNMQVHRLLWPWFSRK